jgi:tetratricopeptide (TPR) repeat protein
VIASSQDKRTSGQICLFLAIGTLLIYSRVFFCGFTNYDDPNYITENFHVKTGLSVGNVAWAFTTGHASNWHPLTWISHMVDCQFFGLNPGGPHAVNLLLHTANTLLLFGVLKRMTGAVWRSACVAALFAWHPLHVESVAWLSERKDVLSTFFWMLTMLAYLRYATELKARTSKAKVFYGLTLLCFACGLMSKPMVVTLPFVLLLLDFWPLRRISDPRFMIGDSKVEAEGRFGRVSLARAFLEKTPMFALAVAASVVTFLVQQHGGAVQSLETLTFQERIANALVTYLRYVGHTIWPGGLSIYYPFKHDLPVWQWAGAAVILLGVTVAALVWRRQRPFFIAGWLWYLGTLVPVIGLVQVGTQAMADRYTYLPLVGLFIATVWGANEAVQRMPRMKVPFFAAGGAALTVCAVLTVVQVGYWHDSISLFKHAIAVTRDNSLAHVNLGEAYDRLGRTAEAKEEFTQALKIDPDSPSTINGLGEVYAHGGDATNAVKLFESALRKRPYFGDALYNLGNVLAAEGKYAEAAGNYAKAVQAKPDKADAHNNLGAMYVKLGRLDDAVKEFQAALRANPNLAEAEDDLAGVYLKQGQPAKARAHYAEAIRIDPNFAHAHSRLGYLLAREGRGDLALTHFEKVIELEPNNGAAYRDLAGAYMVQKLFEKAGAAYTEAIRIDPNDAAARSLLGGVYLSVGNYESAIKSFREALRVNPDLVGALRNLAWILATNPRAELRNGPEALRLAEHLNQLDTERIPRLLECLDVAQAEVGRFDDAVKTAEQVRQLAAAAGDTNTAGRAAQRIEIYRAGKPFRE